jgi:hypothetical protein
VSSGLGGGSAAREQEEGGRRCGLVVRLGGAFIGWRRKGRRRGKAVAELGRPAINAGGSVEAVTGGERKGEAAVGEWGGV